jgi:hypothetical protein
MNTESDYNIYSAPKASLVNPAVFESDEYIKIRRKYLKTIGYSLFLPIFLAPIFIVTFVPEAKPIQIAGIFLIVLIGGWIFSIPFAFLNSIQLNILRRLHYRFSLRRNLFVMPALFTGVWLSAVGLVYKSTLSVHESFWLNVGKNYSFVLVLALPALVTGIVSAFVWSKK